MSGSLENSLDDLFSEGGALEDEALAQKKELPRANAEDWLEPDAVALSPDDPAIVVAGQTGSDHYDHSEVDLEPADAPPLEIAKPGDGP